MRSNKQNKLWFIVLIIIGIVALAKTLGFLAALSLTFIIVLISVITSNPFGNYRDNFDL